MVSEAVTALKPLTVSQLFLVLQLLRINKWEHPILVGMMMDQDLDTDRGISSHYFIVSTLVVHNVRVLAR